MEYPVYHKFTISDKLHLDSLYTASRRRFASDYAYKGESHDFYEIVCVADGKAGVTAGNEIYMLSAGQMIVHPPNEFHNLWSDGEIADIIIFSFGTIAFPESAHGVFTLSPEELFRIQELFTEAENTLSIENNEVVAILDGKETEASLLLKKLEIFLLDIFSHAHANETGYRSRSAENYLRILSAMESRLNSSPSAEELAAACSISVPTLEKTVRRYAGQGAMKHFLTMKIKRANKLLEEGLSVKETAYSLGFADPNYFSAVFKRHTGYSPTHWKKN